MEMIYHSIVDERGSTITSEGGEGSVIFRRCLVTSQGVIDALDERTTQVVLAGTPNVGDSALEAMGRLCPRLQCLRLESPWVTDAGLDHVRQLCELHVHACHRIRLPVSCAGRPVVSARRIDYATVGPETRSVTATHAIHPPPPTLRVDHLCVRFVGDRAHRDDRIPPGCAKLEWVYRQEPRERPEVPAFHGYEHLVVSYCRLGAVVASPPARLTVLSVVHCGLDDDGLATLLGACASLCRLDVRHNPLDGGWTYALPARSRLQSVKVARTQLDDLALALLTCACPDLRKLDVSGCPVTDDGLRAIGVQCPKLEDLSVARCREVTGHGVVAADHGARAGLKRLNVDRCPRVEGWQLARLRDPARLEQLRCRGIRGGMARLGKLMSRDAHVRAEGSDFGIT